MKRSSRQGGASERIWKLRSKINDNVKSIMKLAPSDARHRCLQSRGLSPVPILVACVRASKRTVMRQEAEAKSKRRSSKSKSKSKSESKSKRRGREKT